MFKTLNLEMDYNWAEKTEKVNSLQNNIFLNLWLTNKDTKFMKKIDVLFGQFKLHNKNYLSLQKTIFWTKKARKFNKHK
jgi:hypothetical protein